MNFKNNLFCLFLCITSFLFSQENTIVDVKIKGIKRLKESFIQKIIQTKKGVVLDSAAIEKDIILLKRLPAVGHAYY
ncbi:POTRA domain-containing protein [Polaribacter atrinae]